MLDVSLRETEAWGGTRIFEGFPSHSPAGKNSKDERKSLDATESRAMAGFHARDPNEAVLVPIQTAIAIAPPTKVQPQ